MQFTLNISNKKLLKRILAITLPVFVVGASITTYLVKTKNNDTPVINNNVTITNGVKWQVFLINKNNLLTPLTVVIEKKELVVDELKELMNLLKEDSKLKNENFNKVLNKECDIKNITLEDSTVTLNFTESFNNYDEKNEKRIVESLVWTCLQYDEITNVKLQVEDVNLTYMPLNNTPLPSLLTKDIGINNHLCIGDTTKETVNVFYETTIENDKYYVPVSIKVDNLDNNHKEIINGMTYSLPLYTNLKIPSLVNRIEVLKYNEIDENNNLNLELSSKALYDETTIDNSVFNLLVMNLMFNDKNIETVSVSVNNEVLMVSGYEENTVPVSNITYNEIKL